MTTKSKSKQEEALAFLDDLDNIAPPPPEASTGGGAPPAAAAPKPGEGEAEFLAFIDEITQKSAEPVPQVKTRSPAATLSRSGTPTVRKSTERFKLSSQGRATPPAPAAAASEKSSGASEPQEAPQAEGGSGGGWGWGSWNTGSVWNAVQQARHVVEEQAKNLPQNEQARKWGEGVIAYANKANLPVDINKLGAIGADFKRVGLSTLTDILNVVAPPISEHEVIRVWLSHDLRGYDGIQSLVYRALIRILEQVEGGDLIVNSGKEIRPKEHSPDEEGVRDLAVVDGYETALKLSQANLEELIKLSASHEKKTTQSNITVPLTYSDVYLRIQAYTATRHLPTQIIEPDSQATTPSAPPVHQDIHFLLYLSDPSHSLTHTTVTQAVPADWIDLWNGNAEKYEWVEDLMAEALRIGVEVLGQGYVVERMGWTEQNNLKVPEEGHAQQRVSSETSEDAVKVDKEDAA
ncbi:maintenance of telomere capping protein 1 [Schizophyllum commune]